MVDCTGRTVVMGILNVTPDSFSDGGQFATAADAVACARAMLADGAGIIDVGPESTRPGSEGVSAGEQIARAVPVIEGIRAFDPDCPISIDTRLAGVARAAVDAGADIVNDTSALRDDDALVDVIASTGAAVVLMHRRGQPVDMQRGGGPAYENVLDTLASFFAEREMYAIVRGVDSAKIVFDPGIGFGKRAEDNLRILRDLHRLVSLGRPVLVGASRKRFIGHVLTESLGREVEAAQRDAASIGVAVWAAGQGTAIVRVHDVRGTVEALRVVESIRAVSGL